MTDFENVAAGAQYKSTQKDYAANASSFRLRFGRLRKRQRLTYRQISERTGLSQHWLRQAACRGGRHSGIEELERLAQFFGLESWRDWFAADDPEIDRQEVKELLEVSGRELMEAGRIYEEAEAAFLRLWWAGTGGERFPKPEISERLKRQWQNRKATITKFALQLLDNPDSILQLENGGGGSGGTRGVGAGLGKDARRGGAVLVVAQMVTRT
jgi:transcriptional regulator with XRE-family HTH domain